MNVTSLQTFRAKFWLAGSAARQAAAGNRLVGRMAGWENGRGLGRRLSPTHQRTPLASRN